jgi:hypothetical protein
MEKAFVNLKKCIMTAPILTHVNPNLPYIAETEESDLAREAVLSHTEDDDMQYLIAYYSRKFSLAEIMYEINDQELLGFVDYFKLW